MHKILLLCSRANWLIAICLTSLIIFSSCTKKSPDKKLIEIKDGLICSIYNGEPYTGKVTDVVNQQKLEYDVIQGIKEGDFKVFSESGKEIISGEMKNNKNEGLWQYFYPDGNLESQGNFKDDLVNDRWIWYFPNGKLKATGSYLNGKKDGKWTKFNEEGKILTEQVFRNDKVVADMKDLST